MIKLITLISIISIFTLPSCSNQTYNAANANLGSNSEQAKPLYTFEEACDEFGLECGSLNLYSDFTGDMWSDIVKIVDAFLAGKSTLDITRAQFDSGEIHAVLNNLEIYHLVEPMEKFLASLDWHLMTVGKNKAISILINNTNSEYVFDTNLRLEATSNEVKFNITGDLVTISGLNIGFPDKESSRFISMKWVEGEGFFVVTENEEIAGVPLKFLFGHTEDIKLPDFKEFEIPMLIDQARAAIDFIYKLNHKIELENQFMKIVSQVLSKYNDKPEALNLSDLLLNIQHAAEVPGTRQINAKLTKGIRYVKCRMQQPGTPTIAMDFRKSFGVKNIVTHIPGELTIELYDVRASVDVYGPIDPGFDLKEILINQEGIIIKNVPVIKQFSLKWDDVIKDDVEVSFTCKKR